MKRQPWIAAVLIAIASASCATAPTPRLGLAVLPSSIGVVPSQSASDPLGITLFPRITPGGGAGAGRVRVEPCASSRSLEAAAGTADGIGGTHRTARDGARAARRYDVPIKRLDPGHYEVTAVLLRADGTRIHRSTPIPVIG